VQQLNLHTYNLERMVKQLKE